MSATLRELSQIYTLFSIIFPGLNRCLCTKNDKFEVCTNPKKAAKTENQMKGHGCFRPQGGLRSSQFGKYCMNANKSLLTSRPSKEPTLCLLPPIIFDECKHKYKLKQKYKYKYKKIQIQIQIQNIQKIQTQTKIQIQIQIQI